MLYGELKDALEAVQGAALNDSAVLMIGRLDSSGDYSESDVESIRIAYDFQQGESTPTARIIFVES